MWRALVVHYAVTARYARFGHALGVLRLAWAANVGRAAGMWPCRPPWLWAAVRPNGIVKFSIFLGFIQIDFKSNSV
jgi:hypothetical protein